MTRKTQGGRKRKPIAPHPIAIKIRETRAKLESLMEQRDQEIWAGHNPPYQAENPWVDGLPTTGQTGEAFEITSQQVRRLLAKMKIRAQMRGE